MKIVIDIPESIYDAIMDDKMISREQLAVLEKHIYYGTPLPKGHGRLIDADELYEVFIDGTEGYDCNTWNRIEIGDIIEDLPTIIEANKAESEEEE